MRSEMVIIICNAIRMHTRQLVTGMLAESFQVVVMDS